MRVACYKCGVVLELSALIPVVGMHGERVQLSAVCPICGNLVARTIGGKAVEVRCVEGEETSLPVESGDDVPPPADEPSDKLSKFFEGAGEE